jgi:hypothetical protein
MFMVSPAWKRTSLASGALDFAARARHVVTPAPAMMAMTPDNPLLDATGLPRFSAIRPEHVQPAVDAVLANYRARIDALLASDAPRDFARVMLAGEELEDRLNRV